MIVFYLSNSIFVICVPIPSQDIPMLSVAEDPVTEGPATEGPVAEDPVTEDPVAEDNNISDGFELDRDQLTVVLLLGTGNFGQVSKAFYEASRLDVAVKSLRGIDFISLFVFSFSAVNSLYISFISMIGHILSVLSIIDGFKQPLSRLKSVRKIMSYRTGKKKWLCFIFHNSYCTNSFGKIKKCIVCSIWWP